MRFVDLFAGLGGFHRALSDLGHECVFASELDDELREIYLQNFASMSKHNVKGDIRSCWEDVPEHDVLCAGFPCQPFSKSGGQLGTLDETRGTLFHSILDILRKQKDKRPRYVILENVGNFGRHDGGRTWQIVRESLIQLGYTVRGTEHVTPRSERDWRDVGEPCSPLDKKLRRPRLASKPAGESGYGFGLISPHHYGYPHHRERFFIIASLTGLPSDPFPPRVEGATPSLADIVQPKSELTLADRRETALSEQQRNCIVTWNDLLQAVPEDVSFPAAPIWGDELGAKYPYWVKAPFAFARRPGELRKMIAPDLPGHTSITELLPLLPSYAREEVTHFRNWKRRFIRENRDWWLRAQPYIPAGWAERLRAFPSSLRKLEWNVKGGERDLWKYVLQFRPSGLRAKRYSSSPALIAMTDTQIPILGPEGRFLTRVEGRRLQGFPDDHILPQSRTEAFRALGNGVHVEVVKLIAARLLGHAPAELENGSLRKTG